MAPYIKGIGMLRHLICLILLITASSANAQIVNGDFENWTSAGWPIPLGWSQADGAGVAHAGPGGATKPDTLAQHGQYAITMSRWYCEARDAIIQQNVITTRPAGLQGYYRYANNDLFGGKKDTA